MKQFSSLKSQWRACLGVATVLMTIYLASFAVVRGQDAKTADPQVANTNSAGATMNPAKPEKKAGKKHLAGADLYQINCNRCHAERYPTEFTSAQWKTVMIHMRVRANLPAAQAKLILQYLQEDSGN